MVDTAYGIQRFFFRDGMVMAILNHIDLIEKKNSIGLLGKTLKF